MTYTLTTGIDRMYFRPIASADAAIITTWRNTDVARESFFDKRVVTPDTHLEFIANRKPHDLVWMCYECANDMHPVGMTALTVDVNARTAEYGRLYIPDSQRGKGLAKRIEWATLWAAFEWLRVEMVWLVAYNNNDAVIALHNHLGWLTVPEDARYHPDEHTIEMRYYAEQWHKNKDRVKP